MLAGRRRRFRQLDRPDRRRDDDGPDPQGRPASREKIIAGKELSATLHATRQFSHDVIAIIESGEETGKLPESLEHLADDYEEQVHIMVKNLGHLVQPLIRSSWARIVLFIILAVFLPYIQMLLTCGRRMRGEAESCLCATIFIRRCTRNELGSPFIRDS